MLEDGLQEELVAAFLLGMLDAIIQANNCQGAPAGDVVRTLRTREILIHHIVGIAT